MVAKERKTILGTVINGWRIVSTAKNISGPLKYEAECVSCGKKKVIPYMSIHRDSVEICECNSNGKIIPLKRSKIFIEDHFLGTSVNGWKVIGIDMVAPGQPKKYMLMCEKCGRVKSVYSASISKKTARVCHCIYNLCPKTSRQEKVYEMFVNGNMDTTSIAKVLGASNNSVCSSINAMMKHYYDEQIKSRRDN